MMRIILAKVVNLRSASSHKTDDDHNDRSSCQGMFCKKAVLKYFAKLARKRLCQSLLFNNTFLYRTLPVAAFLMTTSEHLRKLLRTASISYIRSRSHIVMIIK